jgi:hypothetical protein
VVKRRVLDRVVGGLGWWVGGSFKLIGMGLGRSSRTKGVKIVGQGGEVVGRVLGEVSGMDRAIADREKAKVKEKTLLDKVIAEKENETSAISSGAISIPDQMILDPPERPRDEL